VPGIVGLREGVRYLVERGLDNVERHGRELTERLIAGLRPIAGLRIMGAQSAQARVPLVSVVIEGYDPQEVALVLDAAHRIQVRAGLHCAPLMHEVLGTARAGGTVRFSLGAFTTEADVDAAVEAVAEIASTGMLI
jgi:selenocysteine lyase/cysteine desulfurase